MKTPNCQHRQWNLSNYCHERSEADPTFGATVAPSVHHWPASLRSLTFLQSKSQALDVELRSCSLKDRRSFSLTEFLLDDIANPPLFHNNDVLLVPKTRLGLILRYEATSSRRVTCPYNHSSKSQFGSRLTHALVNILGGKFASNYSRQKVKRTTLLQLSIVKIKLVFHISQQMCVHVRLRVCVKGPRRNGCMDVIPSRAVGKTKIMESWNSICWLAKLKHKHRGSEEWKQCPE